MLLTERKRLRNFADNLFLNVHLIFSLQKKYWKHISEIKKDENINRGDIDMRMHRNPLSITKLMDNRNVYFVSDTHDPSLLQKASRKQKNEITLEIGGATLTNLGDT